MSLDIDRPPADYTPAAKLPLELLEEIIQHASLLKYYTYSPGGSYIARSFQLRLLAVSRRWRHIVLASHRLWAHLHVSCHEKDSGGWDTIADVIHTWLSRSAMLPLDITVILPPSGRARSRIMDVLFAFAPRWRAMEMTLAGWPGLDIPVTLPTESWPQSLPLLEKLVLHGSVEFTLTANQRTLWPKLRELRLGHEQAVITGDLQFFGHLSVLSLLLHQPSEILLVLMHCHALEHLAVDLDAGWEEDLDASWEQQKLEIHIRLANLVSLDLGHHGNHDIEALVQLAERSDCPLAQLHISYDTENYPFRGDGWIMPLLPLFARLPPTMNAVTLACRDWAPDDFLIPANAILGDPNLGSGFRKIPSLTLEGVYYPESEMVDAPAAPIFSLLFALCLGSGLPGPNLKPQPNDSESSPREVSSRRLRHVGLPLKYLKLQEQEIQYVAETLGLTLTQRKAKGGGDWDDDSEDGSDSED
ncbi:hypothetical protein HMN09_00475500 [Mycena chlorophos]|uniref:F-box domain-containing protein n=1 Tax=Mycena chlorophos TaxID=658473 RepID=A0A8H6TIP0_MYCCL|nr:hypothetical protein HMN09_00475500 [Mycena chlorophos]